MTESYPLPPKMIIFDKDGTLGDCTPSLRYWCNGMKEQIEHKCRSSGMPQYQINFIVSKFYKAVGWDVFKNDVKPSAPLSAATWDEIIDTVYHVLVETCLYAPSNAPSIDIRLSEVQEWHRSLGDVHEHDEPVVKNLSSLLQHFKEEYGIIISVCTSDHRSSTDKCLINWGITSIVDYSLCGDEVEEPKPSISPLMELCGRAGVHPRDCWVVGDTHNDTLMGHYGGCGLTVGVLSGSGIEEQLLNSGADIVLPTVQYLKPLLRNGHRDEPSPSSVIDETTPTTVRVKAA